MSDVVGIPGNRIRSFVERIEQIENEIKELNEAKKEVFSEAKGEGFDVKILKEIIKLRRQDQASVTSTRACSTSTCAPWMKQAPLLWLRRPNRALKIEDDEKAAYKGAAFFHMECRAARPIIRSASHQPLMISAVRRIACRPSDCCRSRAPRLMNRRGRSSRLPRGSNGSRGDLQRSGNDLGAKASRG